MNRHFLLLISGLFVISLKGQFRNSCNDMPLASIEKLDSNQIRLMSSFDLLLIRNEVFAYHGYIFKTPEMRLYFENRLWYHPKYNNVDNLLTEIEKYNVKLIKDYEETGFINFSNINQDQGISEISFFKGNNSKFSSRDVMYGEIKTGDNRNSQSYIYQQILDYSIDEYSPVDDPSTSKITLNIFIIKNDSFKLYKTLRVVEDYLTVWSVDGRLIYKAETSPSGSDGMVYKLVDIKDGFPFVISNYEDQYFEIIKDKSRWISCYIYAQEDWLYDQKTDFITEENTRYKKVSSVVYSDLDKIYQILDFYKPYADMESSIDFTDPKISLEPHPDKIKFEKSSDNKIIYVDDYTNFDIVYHFKNHNYRFPIIQNKIDTTKFEDQGDGLIARIREIK